MAQIKTLKQQWGALKILIVFPPSSVPSQHGWLPDAPRWFLEPLMMVLQVACTPLRKSYCTLKNALFCININLFKTCYRGVKVKFWVFVALDFSSWKRFEQKKIEGGRESFSMQSSIILLLLSSLNHLSSLRANFYNFEIEIQRGEFQEWGFANTHLLGAVELANAVIWSWPACCLHVFYDPPSW